MSGQPAPLLTEREREILRLLTHGLTDSEIAEALVLTVGTVKWYNRQIYSKLDVRNRTQALTEAQRLKLLDRPAPSHPAARHNLPANVTSFIGREHELAALGSILATSRLVTLTGAPGTGKTRLALEAAAAVADRYRDGVTFISLAPLREPDMVAHHIAKALDIQQTRGHDSLAGALKATLVHHHCLLVLDNFEHLLPAATLVSELLAAAPDLTVLVTSREILRLYGEHEFPVPPLQLPDAHTPAAPAKIAGCEAVTLFMHRATAAAPGFELTEENAASVAAICIHLDGLPLAIELAAARIKYYAPQNLLLRLSSRLEALSDGPRDLPARQRTLRATLAWSYDLLTGDEQALFARLGVFAGSSRLAEIEVLCADLNVDTAALLESLLNKSLLRPIPGNSIRYVMLETMREFAQEKLAERNEQEAVAARHARLFADIAALASEAYSGPNEAVAIARLEADHDNLRAALRWTLDHEDVEAGVRFAIDLQRLWALHGHLSEGRAWMAEALERYPAETMLRADGLLLTADIAFFQADYAATQRLYREALTLYRRLGNMVQAGHSLLGLGDTATEMGDYETAASLFMEAYAMVQALGDDGGTARACMQLGWAELRNGQPDKGRQWLEQGLAIYQRNGFQAGMALMYAGLGEAAIRQNRLDDAEALLGESLKLRRALGDAWGTGVCLGSLAWLALRQNDLDRAARFLSQSLRIRVEIGDQGGLSWCLEKFADIAVRRADAGRAVRLYGAAACLRAKIHSVIDPVDRADYEAIQGRLVDDLGDDIYRAVWAEGERMPIETVIAYASPEPQA